MDLFDTSQAESGSPSGSGGETFSQSVASVVLSNSRSEFNSLPAPSQCNSETVCEQRTPFRPGQSLMRTKSQSQRINTSFSTTLLHSTFSIFNEEKKELVRSIGFGALLEISSENRFPRSLALWILRRMNYMTGEISARNSAKLTVKESDVELVLGLPCIKNKVEVVYPPSLLEISRVRNLLLLDTDSEITVESVRQILVRDYGRQMSTLEQQAFKVALVLFVDSAFLGPKGSNPKINQHMYKNVLSPETIPELNWCAYVLDTLLQSSKRVQASLESKKRTVTLEGCLLFLVVFYLDNVKFPDCITSSKTLLPRILAYPFHVIKILEKSDKIESPTSAMGLYGRHEVIEDDKVIYSRNINLSNNTTPTSGMTRVPKESIPNDAKLDELISKLETWSSQVQTITLDTRTALVEYFKRSRVDVDASHISGNHIELRDPETSCQVHGTAVEETMENVSSCLISSIQTGNYQRPAVAEDIANCQSASGSEQIHTDTLKEISSRITNMSLDEMINKTSLFPSETIYTDSETDEWDYGLPMHDEVFEQSQHDVFTKDLSSNAITTIHIDSDTEECESMLPIDQEGPERLMLGFGDKSGYIDSAIIKDNDESIELQIREKLQELGILLNDTEVLDNQCDVNHQDKLSLLLVTKSADSAIISYGDGVSDEHTFVINDTKVVIEYENKSCRFGVSPFAIGINHPDAPLSCQLAIQVCIDSVIEEDLSCNWYMHMYPTKICLHGAIIKNMLRSGTEFVPDVINALVRMFQHMDCDMYSNWEEKRWRHYLPSDFGVWALHENRQKPTDLIRDMFLGGHIGYNVADCRLIMVPLLVHWNWCLYAWDYQMKTIVVLDPCGNQHNLSDTKAKHKKCIQLMQSAMELCMSLFFSTHSCHMDNWNIEYLCNNSGHVDRNSSGLYSMFYARYFDGQFITRLLTKEACQLQRSNMVYQLLSMDGNIGRLPQSLIDAIYSWD